MRKSPRNPRRLLAPSLAGGAAALGALLSPAPAPAAETCRTVEVRFLPQGLPARDGREPQSPQIAVWVETSDGQFVGDVFVTRLVGLLGLGNRPGQARLKSDFRWPYGRRPGALPIWAHHRGKRYGYVVMGGKCSRVYDAGNPRNSTCPNDFTGDPSDDDRTIAYHGPVSSDEPFYCSPSGWRTQSMGGVDVISCASSFYGSKGWYAPGLTSPYPPRGDLQALGGNDHPDVMRFSRDNDVAAVSGATPPTGQLLEPPARWVPQGLPDGDYLMQVEVNLEGDFNAFWGPGKSVNEPHLEWNKLGHEFLGQPSILYSVPFRLDDSGRTATVRDYAGHGDWTGESGAVSPAPDMTISTSGGSGADRLKVVSDDNGDWRVKVQVVPCGDTPCVAPGAPEALEASERTDSTVTLSLRVPAGEPVAQYQVKYQAGAPITDENFDRAQPAPAPPLGLPGRTVQTRIEGLLPQTRYYVAARSRSRCGLASKLVTTEATTQNGNFTTLSGCFIATAAYGTELADEVQALRRLRDEVLLKGAAGQALVASYYAVSPPLAGLLGTSEPLRGGARALLRPVVRLTRALR